MEKYSEEMLDMNGFLSKQSTLLNFIHLGFLLLITLASCKDDGPDLSTGSYVTISGNQSGRYIADAEFNYMVSSGTNGWNGTYLTLGVNSHKASGPQIYVNILKLEDASGLEVGKKYLYNEFTNLPSLSFSVSNRSSVSRSGPHYQYQINKDSPGNNWFELSFLSAEKMKGNFEFNLETQAGEKLRIIGTFDATGTAYWFD